MEIEFSRADAPFVSVHAAEKLVLRNGLPGAHAYDLASETMRSALARGLSPKELLPVAFASSWLVNNRATSPVFHKWLASPYCEVWAELAAALGDAEVGWADRDDDERKAIAGAASALAFDGHGAGAVSKVLALLAPDAVPLMPDAAICFALGTRSVPDTPDAQTAGIEYFEPMMTWFAGAVAQNRAGLEALAMHHRRATGVALSAAQVLDRLLWFESAGYRQLRPATGPRWYWIASDGVEAVVPIATAYPGTEPRDRPIDLALMSADEDAVFCASARRALAAARAAGDAS